MTKYEKAIYLLIHQSIGHPTAEQVFCEMRKEYPAISLATVYNNLKKLCDAGLIRWKERPTATTAPPSTITSCALAAKC